MKEEVKSERELFDLVKSKPTEVSFERVEKMVAGFPLIPPPFDWSSIINLNSIIMTTVGTFILAGSFMLYSGNVESESMSSTTYQIVPDTEQTNELQVPQNINLLQENEGTDEANTASSPIPQEPDSQPQALAMVPPTVLPITPAEPEENVVEIEVESSELPGEFEQERVEEPEVAEEQEQPEEVFHPESEWEDDNSKEFSVGSFRGVGLSGSYDMEVSQGSNFSVRAEGDSKTIENMEVYVKNNMLHVKSKSKRNQKNCNDYGKNAVIYITMPSFDKLSVGGSGHMTIGSFTGLDDIDLSVAGSGVMRSSGDLEVSGFSDFSIAGSGDMNIDGQADDMEISIAGSGEFKGFDYQCNTVRVSIAGSGDVSVYSRNELDVSIAGSGDVAYEGNPRVTQSIAGSGDVHQH